MEGIFDEGVKAGLVGMVDEGDETGTDRMKNNSGTAIWKQPSKLSLEYLRTKVGHFGQPANPTPSLCACRVAVFML